MNLLRPTKGRQTRLAKGITAYVGANGSGKTTCMAWDTLPTLLDGLPVLSTLRLLDFQNPRPCEEEGCGFASRTYVPGTECDKDDPDRHMHAHPLWVPLTSWLQVMAWEYGDILLDEVSGVAGSRDHHAMPSEVGTHLQQLRKDDCVTRWNAPTWQRADSIIRGCTQLVVSCRGFLPVQKATRPEVLEDGAVSERLRRWRQNRLFVWRSFDAYEFEDFTADKRDKLKPVGTDRHWGPGSPAFNLFDTYSHSLTIGTVTVQGVCMICGGSRRRPACTGHDGDPIRLAS